MPNPQAPSLTSRSEAIPGRPALCVLAALLLSSAGAPVLAQRTPRPQEPELIPVHVTGEQFERWWREDPAKLARKLATCMTPEQYHAALEATGMAAALAAPPPEAGPTWTLSGPKGAFGSSPRNGRVSGIELHASSGRVYAGASQGGLWYSDLASPGTWTSIGDLLPNPSLRAFAVDPNDADHIFAATGDVGRYAGAGMFETTNGGASWTQVSLGASPKFFYTLDFLFGGSGSLYAASSSGLFRKSPLSTWTIDLSGHITDFVSHPTQLGKHFAMRETSSLNGGVFVRTPPGVAWVQQTDPDLPPASMWGRGHLALCRDAPETMVMVITQGGDLTGVYKTTDGGSDWKNITGSLASAGAFGGSQAFHALAIAIKPDDPKVIFVGAAGLVMSTDGGATWLDGTSEHGIDYGHADISQLHFDPATGDNQLWITNDGGIYKVNLATKVTVSGIGTTNGLSISEVDYLDGNRAMRAIGMQDNGIMRTTDYGATWADIATADGAQIQITDPIARDFWFTKGFYTSAPSWRTFRRKFSSSSEWFSKQPEKYIAPFFYDPFGDRIYAIDSTSIFSVAENASPDSTWSVEFSGAWGQDAPYSLRRVWGSRANGRSLFVNYWDVTGDENERDLTIFERPINGQWVAHHVEDLVASGEIVQAISPSTEWPGECWVGVTSAPGQPKVLHTTDYGASWQDVSGELSALNQVLVIANTPFDPNTLYAGTDIGIFRTTNGGQSWEPFQTGLPIAPVRELKFLPNLALGTTHDLVAGTSGRGVWTRSIPGKSIVYVDKLAPTPFEDGSFVYPFHDVAGGVAAAPVGAIIAIRANTYFEPVTTAKDVTLVSWAGDAVLR